MRELMAQVSRSFGQAIDSVTIPRVRHLDVEHNDDEWTVEAIPVTDKDGNILNEEQLYAFRDSYNRYFGTSGYDEIPD